MIAIVLCVASRVASANGGFFSKIGGKIVEMLVYNGLIRTVLETSIYIFLGSFLSFKFGYANEAHAIVNIILSGIALFLLYLFARKIYAAIRDNNGYLGDD